MFIPPGLCGHWLYQARTQMQLCSHFAQFSMGDSSLFDVGCQRHVHSSALSPKCAGQLNFLSVPVVLPTLSRIDVLPKGKYLNY